MQSSMFHCSYIEFITCVIFLPMPLYLGLYISVKYHIVYNVGKGLSLCDLCKPFHLEGPGYFKELS